MNGVQPADHVTAYLDAVCARIRFREVHGEIRRELAGHIADLVDAHVAAGLAEEEAVARSLAEMGDPAAVGEGLDRAHRPRTEWGLLAATLALTLLGIWAMYAVEASGSARLSGLLTSKLVWSAAGLGAGAALYWTDYRRLRRWAWPLYGVTLAGLGALLLIAPQVNGRLLYVGITPPVFLIALAGICADWNWDRPLALVHAALLLAVPPLVYIGSGESFAVVEYVAGSAVLLALTRPGWRRLTLMGGVAGGLLLGLGLLVIRTPYLAERVQVWLHPGRDPLGYGYHVSQSLQAVRSAGPWGQGATAPLPLLPEIPTDFIFPYLVYTLGWVAGAGIVLLAGLLIARLWHVGTRIREPFGRYLAGAVTTVFALHLGWNLLMTMGLLPIAGVSLPLVSHGARQVLYLAAAGLALSVYRRRDLGESTAAPAGGPVSPALR